jgi:S1-C subfamily serine protease
MIKFLSTSLVLFIISSSSVAQKRDFPYADAVTFLGTENHSKQLKKVVFAVQIEGNQSNQDKKDDWIFLGSGFFVSGKNKKILGVTCKHVVDPASKAKKAVYIGVDTESGYQRFNSRIVHTEQKHDIAILALLKKTEEAIGFKNIIFQEEMFDDSSSLIEGRGVLIPGYPLALGIEDDTNHPVIRFGIIAQYTGKDIFLVDGFASHGNSGSPVFAIKYKKSKLVGMITSHVTDHITLLDENGRISARLPYNSGLARVIKTEKISESLEKTTKKINSTSSKK